MAAAHPYRGFALIEVLAATTIAMLALAAVMRFQIELVRADQLAAQRSTAAILAEERGESLQAETRAGFEVPASGTDTPADAMGSAGLYARDWLAQPSRRAVDLEVRVSWPEGAPLHDVRLSSAAAAAAAVESGYAAIVHAPVLIP